jgi:tight adherence protein B
VLKVIILLLSFSSIGLILWQILPKVLEGFEQSQKKKFDKTVEKLDKMFVEVKREKLLPIFTLGPLILGLAGFTFFHNLLAVLAGLGLGFVLPSVIVKNLEKKRKQKFHNQLIDALLLLSSSLKSGLSFLQAIEVVVEEMPAPISQEFNLLLNENKIGVAFEESLERLNKRMYSEELNMIITSVLISRETGGDLSRIFSRLVLNIRQKNKIARQVETLTLQARWQGMIMMALPIIFAFGISRINPHFFDTMLYSETGRFLLIYAIISQVIGMIMIQRLSKVEI